MEIAVIILAIALAVTIGALVYFAARNASLTDRLLEARDNAGTNAIAAERSKFDADKATQALTGEKTRANALEDFISHEAQSTDPVAPLAPDDVNGRVLRIARQWGSANVPSDTGQAGTSPTGKVRDPAPATTPGAVVSGSKL